MLKVMLEVSMSDTHYLLLDVSSILYRSFFANKNEDEITSAGLAHHTALNVVNKYYKQIKADKTVMAFDRPNWRKQYTLSDECLSGKIYKGNRRQKMTPSQKQKFERFMGHIKEFESIIDQLTSIICLSCDKLEADDLIAFFTQIHSDDKITIISSDKDLLQLTNGSTVKLIDPASGKERTLEEWNNDVDYFIFEKCIRGDVSDNVQNAFPRVRKSRIKLAYENAYEHTKLMNETWTDPVSKRNHVVKDLFNENKLLMDLTCQPKELQKLGIKHILSKESDPGNFSFFHFLQFCGKYQLKEISKNITNFTDMLNN